jgi:hypothetical protein
MVGSASNPPGVAGPDVLAKALDLIESTRLLAAAKPDAFEMLTEMVVKQFNQLRVAQGLSPVGWASEVSTAVVAVGPDSVPKDPPKTTRLALKWNKTRKSLAVEYLILMCLILNSEGILTVDQVAAFVGQVFPIEGDNARASLIAKLARLKNEKNCLDRDEELKGLGYRISDGGRDYLRRLKDAYLTRDELVFLQERIGVTRV